MEEAPAPALAAASVAAAAAPTATANTAAPQPPRSSQLPAPSQSQSKGGGLLVSPPPRWEPVVDKADTPVMPPPIAVAAAAATTTKAAAAAASEEAPVVAADKVDWEEEEEEEDGWFRVRVSRGVDGDSGGPMEMIAARARARLWRLPPAVALLQQGGLRGAYFSLCCLCFVFCGRPVFLVLETRFKSLIRPTSLHPCIHTLSHTQQAPRPALPTPACSTRT